MSDSSHVRRKARGPGLAPDGVPVFEPAGRLVLRPGRQLALVEVADSTAVIVVESGCLMLETILRDGLRRTLLLIYPGDEISTDLIAALPRLELVAATQATVVRCSDRSHIEPVRGGASAYARLLARSALHAMAVGHLEIEERLATLLVEMGIHLGRAAPGGVVLDLPLNRAAMADYLAINPDTLSRVMARLKARGLIAMPTRRRAILKSVSGLLELTPLVDELRALSAGSSAMALGARAAGH
jgi:CRP/FNR family transcriptional regulator